MSEVLGHEEHTRTENIMIMITTVTRKDDQILSICLNELMYDTGSIHYV
jgi:hypothetical protein